VMVRLQPRSFTIVVGAAFINIHPTLDEKTLGIEVPLALPVRAPDSNIRPQAGKLGNSKAAFTNRVSTGICLFLIGLSAPPYAKIVPERRRSGQLRIWGLREGGYDEHDQKVYSCGRRYGGCDLVLAAFVLRQEITQSKRAAVQRGSGLHG